MSTLFGNLSNEGLEESEDRLGGFSVFETDAYDADIKMFYAVKSDGGAQGVFLILGIGGKEYRETLWMTSKEGKNYFHPKGADGKPDTSKKAPMMGYTLADELCMLTVEKPISEVLFEEKVVNVYDADAKKELPKSVQVATELLGQKVTVGIEKVMKFKQKKDSNGVYQDTNETREENSLVKVFHHDLKITVPEYRTAVKNETAPVSDFYAKWVEKNKGVTKDLTKKGNANGGKAGKPGEPPKSGSNGEPRKSLFNK